MENTVRNTRVSFQGVVVSDKMDKTIIVLVETYKKHSKYGKRVKYASKFVAHDPNSKAKLGDTVTVRGCRPLSKTKRFVLVSVDKTAHGNTTSTAEEEVKAINETIDTTEAPVEKPKRKPPVRKAAVKVESTDEVAPVAEVTETAKEEN